MMTPPSSLDPLFGPGFSLVNRRDVLRVGSLSIAATLVPAGLGRSGSAGAKASGGGRPSPSAAARGGAFGKAQSVVYLWMGGGVTHLESFDPKPEAPDEIRGTLNA